MAMRFVVRRSAPARWAVVMAATLAGMWGIGVDVARADPDALWRIVHDQCVPDDEANRDPAPCANVDLDDGVDRGYAVLKDRVGATQYLLIPTARITGIESPALLEPGATNYFAAAWRARTFTEARAGGPLPRDWISLTINSAVARSQSQLHIHVDCLRADVHALLSVFSGQIGDTWAPFPVPLAGQTYNAMAIPGEELDGVNPFALLADGLPDARAEMGLQTLAVVGTYRPDGRPGFVVLQDRADPETGNRAAAEQLQDHAYCPPSPAPMP